MHAVAAVFSYEQALTQFDELNLKIQTPEKDGRTQTLNKKGAVTAKFDSVTKKFLKYINQLAKEKGTVKVLEVGGTYGDVMLEALKQSYKVQYTLNDLDRRHLFIAAKKLYLQDNRLNRNSTNQVQFIQDDIINAQNIKNSGPYEVIFIARVLHFLNPDQLNAAIRNLFLLLKSGGRIFVVAITPYVKRFDKFIPEYERRVKAGEENPGFVKSLLDYVNTEVTTPEQIKNISEEPFFFLDDKVLRTIFEDVGFKTIECKMMPLSYKSESWELDGHENVILIAEKP